MEVVKIVLNLSIFTFLDIGDFFLDASSLVVQVGVIEVENEFAFILGDYHKVIVMDRRNEINVRFSNQCRNMQLRTFFDKISFNPILIYFLLSLFRYPKVTVFYSKENVFSYQTQFPIKMFLWISNRSSKNIRTNILVALSQIFIFISSTCVNKRYQLAVLKTVEYF